MAVRQSYSTLACSTTARLCARRRRPLTCCVCASCLGVSCLGLSCRGVSCSGVSCSGVCASSNLTPELGVTPGTAFPVFQRLSCNSCLLTPVLQLQSSNSNRAVPSSALPPALTPNARRYWARPWRCLSSCCRLWCSSKSSASSWVKVYLSGALSVLDLSGVLSVLDAQGSVNLMLVCVMCVREVVQ